MSIEVVRLADNRIYLIVGDPEAGYNVYRTHNEPVAFFDRKYEARHAINHDELEP